MKTRIFNARILTMADSRQQTTADRIARPDSLPPADPEIFPGELQIEDDIISYVGPSAEEPQEIHWDREIDAQGNLVMPGFKNAHTHSAMTFLRSCADDLPLQEWLQQQVFPREARLTPEAVYWFSRLAIMEYLTSGITANFDMYMKNQAIAKASIDSGFRTVLCGSINDFGGTVEEIEQEYLHFNNLHGLISYQLGFHAEYTTSPAILQGIAALAHKYQAPVYTHNSETRKEVAECLERYQKTPTAYLDSLDMFDYGGGGFHCVHMTEEDLEICREKKIWVITNPASNTKLASGIAPITQMAEMGIQLAIGTDGPASNNCLDMFREMFLATGLQKLLLDNAAAMDANEVLSMACVGGARAMGLTDCDALEAGKKADLILLDLHRPNMQPLHSISKNLVYSGSKENVKMTMVDGQILYENGQFHIGVDPEEVYAKVAEHTENIFRAK